MKPDLNENLVATVFRTIGMHKDGCSVAVIQGACDVMARELWDAIDCLRERGLIQRDRLNASNWVYTPKMKEQIRGNLQHAVRRVLD